jgi:hypothetical protein
MKALSKDMMFRMDMRKLWEDLRWTHLLGQQWG